MEKCAGSSPARVKRSRPSRSVRDSTPSLASEPVRVQPPRNASESGRISFLIMMYAVAGQRQPAGSVDNVGQVSPLLWRSRNWTEPDQSQVGESAETPVARLRSEESRVEKE